MAKDPIKGIIAEGVQKALGQQEMLKGLKLTIEDRLEILSVEVENQDLSELETFLVVRGLNGPSRYFLVKVSEQM